ncbi:MAG: WG repeat-containing protein [Parahaliea sp.]
MLFAKTLIRQPYLKFLLIILIAETAITTHAIEREAPCPSNEGTTYLDTRSAKLIDASFCQGRDFSDGLAAVFNGSQWGYINPQGSQSISFQYKIAGDFKQGHAVVKKNGQWGVIDKENTAIISFSYLYLQPLEINKQFVFIAGQKDPSSRQIHYGVISSKNKILIPFKYAKITYSKETHQLYATLPKNPSKDTETDIYNSALKLLKRLPQNNPEFKKIKHYYAWWTDNQGNFTKDFFEGKTYESPSFNDLQAVVDNINSNIFSHDQKKGIHLNNTRSIAPQYEAIYPYTSLAISDNPKMTEYLKTHYKSQATNEPLLKNHYYIFFYKVEKQGKVGIYTSTGEAVIPAKYSSIYNQKNGFAVNLRTKNGLVTGLADFRGQWIIEPTPGYGNISETINERIIVREAYNGKTNSMTEALFDRHGQPLTDFGKYTSIDHFYGLTPDAISSRYTTVYRKNDLKQGVIDRNGREIIPPKYEYIFYWDDNDIIVILKSYTPEIYQLYYSDTGHFSEDIQAENWLGTIGEAHDGMLKVIYKN